jgi:hypothetical protein
MVDIHIRRAILNHCSPFVLADSEKGSFREARQGFVRSTLVILCYQDLFDPRFVDTSEISSSGYWDLFHVHCTNDLVHASLGVCLEVQRMNDDLSSSGSLPPDAIIANRYKRLQSGGSTAQDASWNKISLIKAVEDNIDPLTRRLGRLGSDGKDLLCLAIVLTFVKTRKLKSEMRDAVATRIHELVQVCLRQVSNQNQKLGGRGSNLDAHKTVPENIEAVSGAVNSSDVDFSPFIDPGLNRNNLGLDFNYDWQFDQSHY